MALRRNVTFRTSVPYDRGLHPVGEEVARHLSELVDREVGSHGQVENWRDSGFELQHMFGDKPVHLALAYTPDKRFDFYAQVASNVGWVRRLFGYRDEEELARLVTAVHRALSSTASFSEVAWHKAWYDERTMAEQP